MFNVKFPLNTLLQSVSCFIHPALVQSHPVPMKMNSHEDEPSYSSDQRMSTSVGDVLLDDYNVHKLPTEGSTSVSCSLTDTSTGPLTTDKGSNNIVTALVVAHVEVLEAENKQLLHKLKSKKMVLKIANISHNDALLKLYTGFPSYEQLLAFYEFLGPEVSHLTYWGAKPAGVKGGRLN